MTSIEVWTLAFALAMDCFTISIAGGVIMKQCKWNPMLTMAFFFGLFQAANPLFGWIAADICKEYIECIDHWIAFAILGYLGISMIIESFKDAEEKHFNPESLNVILTLAVATSIDALAVGVSFSCMGISSLPQLTYPIIVIGIVSFIMSICGLLIGINFGRKFARKLHPELFGGVILIIIGCKVLFEHLYS